MQNDYENKWAKAAVQAMLRRCVEMLQSELCVEMRMVEVIAKRLGLA